MVSSCSQIFTQSSLYGTDLISLPEKAWNAVTKSTPLLYTEPDPGTAKRTYLIFEEFTSTTERWPNGTPKQITFGTNFLPSKYLEIGIRSIIGSLLATALFLTVAPIGLAINAIQLLGTELAKVRSNY